MKKIKRPIIFLVLIAVAVRLFFFLLALLRLPVSSDEAWVGLMSLHMLKGEFPIFYWGQTYMGTQESFFDAPLIHLFGVNAFAIRIYPFICALLFVYFAYQLASRMYNNEVGIITLLLLAIPVPYLAMCSAVIPPDNYMATAMLGSWGLLLAYNLVFTKKIYRENLQYALLGFVLGYGFWNHILVVSYIIVICFFLFVKDKLILFRKKFWFFALSFAVGCLPLIWFNLTHNFATFKDVAYGTSWAGAMANFQTLFRLTLQFLVGLKVMLYGDNWNYFDLPPWLYYPYAVILAGALALVVVISFKRVWRICILSLKNVEGTSLLLVFAAASIYTFCRSGRSNWWAARYILPIMSALPILFAYGLWLIRRFSRGVFYVCVVIVLAAHIWGCGILARAWNDPKTVSWDLQLPDTKPLIEFLDKEGIKHGYAHFWISYRLTYETAEDFICAPPYNERFIQYDVPYIDEVRQADKVVYIMHPTLGLKPEFFEDRVKHISGSYRKKTLGDFTLFYDFKPPYVAEELLEEIPRGNWRVSSNYKPEDAGKVLDNDILTRWGSGAPQKPGMIFSVDLGDVYEVCKIRFELGRFVTDFPRGYKVELSTDNKNWHKALTTPDNRVGLFWEGSHPRFLIRDDFFTASFTAQRGRYLKITQIGEDPRCDWSIAELRVYSQAG